MRKWSFPHVRGVGLDEMDTTPPPPAVVPLLLLLLWPRGGVARWAVPDPLSVMIIYIYIARLYIYIFVCGYYCRV